MAVKFNELLKENRKRVGMTQVELAKKTKIDRTYMSRLEKRESNPSLEMVQKICDGLGMSVIEFFGAAEAKAPAIIINASQADEKELRAYTKRGDLVPIRVYKNRESFSSKRDLAKEFVAKYVLLDKNIFPNHKDIVGLEIDEGFKLLGITFNKPVLFVDVINKEIIDQALYVTEKHLRGRPPIPPITIERMSVVAQGFHLFIPPELTEISLRANDIVNAAQEMLGDLLSKKPPSAEQKKASEDYFRKMVRGRVVGIMGKIFKV